MGAAATGGAADIPDSQAASNGPEYWDPMTDTAWTSYQTGGQWHESYYEGENGFYDVAQLVTKDGARGVGIWALGMENDDAQMIAALDGISPGAPPGTGPQSTAPSAPALAAPAAGRRRSVPQCKRRGGSRRPQPHPHGSGHPAQPGSGSGSGTAPAATPATPAPPAPVTTTTTAASITGVYNGATVSLTPIASSSVLGLIGGGHADRLPDERAGLLVPQRLDAGRLRQHRREARGGGGDARPTASPRTSSCPDGRPDTAMV